jgi:hypothetical protein
VTSRGQSSFLFLVLFVVGWSSAFAQDPAPSTRASGAQFFPRFDFHMTAEHLSDEDPRYVWDTNFGGGLDVVRYRETRLTFAANYQAMLGEQFRSFDPNQGNYILEGALTTKVAGLEVGPVFYHQSRHLSDRFKRDPIDWNMLGGRLAGQMVRGPALVEARLDLRGAVQHTFVDYRWELDTGVRGHYRVHPHVAVVGGAKLRRLGVDGTRNRGSQTGFRADGGLRFEGTAGAIELFVAAERRIDPYQLEFGTESWASVGMRLLSR